MTNPRQKLGSSGEALAIRWLQAKGYTILGTNWRCSHGEIDLIARDADELVFVEVRTRRAATTEAAFESITPRKQARMVRLAHAYLAAHHLESARWRIDLIAIAVPYRGQAVIEHRENGLDW
jgi:putative endonuclease